VEERVPSSKTTTASTTTEAIDPANSLHHRVLRTLDNMDQMFATHSHCPVAGNSNTNGINDDKTLAIRTTLVVQASLDRIRVLQETCRRWKDPIVVVVAVPPPPPGQDHPDDNTSSTSFSLLQRTKEWNAVNCPQLTFITYNMTNDEHENPELYPVNYFRNLGLDAVETSHVLTADVDFVPSIHLPETIRSLLLDEKDDDRHALVVPAFERVVSLLHPCTSDEDCIEPLLRNRSFIPHTFDDLVACYEAKRCNVFQKDVNPAGHSSTRSGEWLQRHWYEDEDENNPTSTVAAASPLGGLNGNNQSIPVLRRLAPKRIKCFDTARYEPYVVIRWCPPLTGQGPAKLGPVAPYYDERFHGYGKNKIELVQHLRLTGYRFSVLPQGFLVHNPHVESKVKQRWNQVEDSDLHRDMDLLYQAFLGELFDKYDSAIKKGVVPLCSSGGKGGRQKI
jgi:hypothetical protein